MSEPKLPTVEDRAFAVAIQIQRAYEDEIEQDSETTAFIMAPILSEMKADRRAVLEAAAQEFDCDEPTTIVTFHDAKIQAFHEAAKVIRKLAEELK